ncbi:hypothetical protein TrLO_g10075 [Triparma laevis f. longispina]|uniref:N-acetyltransferase domain-containing protein n=1 Tax=Triparma laevis f. longispina TaxID=1714387 RepID=A0A9W7C4Q2_9STRA|nr:hypothetical protein TrLO_g10075 [Triparma laevis f. longispina]
MTIRLFNNDTDFSQVRSIWSQNLLSNIETYNYPPSLSTEETEFVKETLESGDMVNIEESYQSNPRTNFWVAIDSDRTVVGCIGLRIGKNGTGDIGRFTVVSDFRGRSCGRMLLSSLEAYAELNEFENITATTCALNLAAVGAFNGLGFEEVFRGRSDGKPEPEYVPFVRFNKILTTLKLDQHEYDDWEDQNFSGGPANTIKFVDFITPNGTFSVLNSSPLSLNTVQILNEKCKVPLTLEAYEKRMLMKQFDSIWRWIIVVCRMKRWVAENNIEVDSVRI